MTAYRWLTSTEAARYLGVSIATLRRWTETSAIPHYRTPGGQRRFIVAELDEWLATHRQEVRPKCP